MRRLLITGLLAALGTLPGSTLRQLSLDDMIRQSTMIVRGTVLPANIVYHGSVIFSHYTIQVTETYKGPGSGQIDFGVPGGNLNGAIQRVAGAPVLSAGQDYVLARNSEEMSARLHELLESEDTRRQIAWSGLQTILQHHTCRHRAEQLMEICGEITR